MNAKNTHQLDIPPKEWGVIKAQTASEQLDARLTYEEAAVAFLCYGIEAWGRDKEAPALEELVRRFNVPRQGLRTD